MENRRKSDIEIRDLSVTFQDGGEMIHAMEDVSAYFPSGSVTGLIGGEWKRKIAFRHVHPGILSGRPGWKEAVCIKGWICTGCRKRDAEDPWKRDRPDPTESHGILKPDPQDRKTAHGVHDSPRK